MTATLVTIRFSHFCEKARWAVERAGIPYFEDYHSPGFHVRAVRRAGGKRTTPVLVLPDQVITDSTDILIYCETQGAGLFPADPDLKSDVVALEDRFDEKLGPAVRRFVYWHVFQFPLTRVMTLFRSAAPPSEARWVGLFHPLVRLLMKRSMKLDAAGAERSRLAMEKVLDDVEARLADGRRYLVGDRFSAADLTFAALFAPLVGPSDYGAPLPGFDDLPEPLAAITQAARARPAGQFVLRLYRFHRRERMTDAPPPTP